MTLVNEGLKAGDLDGVVSKRFSVDQFKSKMGDALLEPNGSDLQADRLQEKCYEEIHESFQLPAIEIAVLAQRSDRC